MIRISGRYPTSFLRWGGQFEIQIVASIQALCERDISLAAKVQLDDKAVDALETRINEATLRTLALRQPLASDLRNIICALKVSSNLERIGDYAKNIAKRTRVLADVDAIDTAEKTIRRMGAMVQQMVADVLNAYLAKDLALAEEVRQRDEDVDHIHNTLFRELLTYMMEEPRNITPCMHMLFIAKNLERMGDHVTGIAEQIYYAETGAMIEDDRPKADNTSQLSS